MVVIQAESVRFFITDSSLELAPIGALSCTMRLIFFCGQNTEHKRSMAQHGAAWRSMAQHGAAWRSMAQHGAYDIDPNTLNNI